MTRQAVVPYPVVLTQLDQVVCVVVGGGDVALRKVTALLNSGARVKVISPVLHPQLVAWHAADRITHIARPYALGDLADALLAIAATDQRHVNAAVADEARSRGMLINLADDPDGSSFHTLGAVTRGDVLLAVSTGGASPALAAYIRRKLEALFGPEYGVLAGWLGELRRSVGRTLAPRVRTQLWRALATDRALEIARSGDQAAFDQFVDRAIAEIESATVSEKHVQ